MPSNGSWVQCECGNASAHWRDPEKGLVGVSAQNQDAVRILGIHNGFLQEGYHRPLTAQGWRDLHEKYCSNSPGYVFSSEFRNCWVAMIRVGETNDVIWEERPNV